MYHLSHALTLFAQKDNPQSAVASEAIIAQSPTLTDQAERFTLLEKRKRIDAPAVFTEESFPDVNIVAEYLNHQLDDPELVNEYEKLCLNDNILLAELLFVFKLERKWEHLTDYPVLPGVRERLYSLQGDSPTRPISHAGKTDSSSPTLSNSPVLASIGSAGGGAGAENRPLFQPKTNCPILNRSTKGGFRQFTWKAIERVTVLTIFPFLSTLFLTDLDFPKESVHTLRTMVKNELKYRDKEVEKSKNSPLFETALLDKEPESGDNSTRADSFRR